MANRPSPPPEFNWGRMLRTLSFLALATVGVVTLVRFASGRGEAVGEVTYTRFLEELDRGNVAAVEVTERQELKGRFRQSVTVGRKKFERFRTLLPFEADGPWAAKLRDLGVEVSAREPTQSFGV